MVGMLAGNYQVLEKLGEGGMGEVYKARDSRLNRFVAIKALLPDKGSDSERKARFIREARAASALNHPNIITVYDILSENGCDYIVMEYVAGETLAKKIADKELRLPLILKYAAQIADALSRAHAAGIIHRDLKPSNIMIAKDGSVKVLDFGLAKQSAAVCAADDTTVTAAKTSEGVVLGTVGYMSPEQVRGQELDQRSDIFSFGLVLYEMLAGRRPFQGQSAVEVMNEILKETPPELPETIPPGLRHIVAECLEKDPAERFQSAHDLAFALRAVSVASGSSGTAPRVETATAGTRRRWLVAGLVGLAVAGLFVTGLWPVPAPKARLKQLTDAARPNSDTLAVHDGRILWTSLRPTSNQSATEFWSVSTNGGAPRSERMPFLDPQLSAMFQQANATNGALLVFDLLPGVDRGHLWLANFEGSKPRQIGEWMREFSYAVSPDLKTLLKTGKEGLYARSIDSRAEKLILRAEQKRPAGLFWHPSGERIGFVLLHDAMLKLWEVNASGGGVRPMLPEFAAQQYAGNWSLDGKRLYFGSQGDIYRLSERQVLGWMRTPRPERLTAGPILFGLAYEDPRDSQVLYSTGTLQRGEAMKLDKPTGAFAPYLGGLSGDQLAYSPDGKWIAYVSYPKQELWKCRRDGSDKVLLDDDLVTLNPRWSPDGKRLVFAGQKKGTTESWRIFTISADGGGAEPVKGVTGSANDPSWSADGRKLVFGAEMSANTPKEDHHISIVDLETGQVQMVPGSEGLFSPRWSPDGKRLVALTWDHNYPFLYEFETRRWILIEAAALGFPTWSRDSMHVFGLRGDRNALLRIDTATRKVDEIRRINEFRLTGSAGVPGVAWTPEGEPVVLADLSSTEIYRIDLEP